jgi:NAD(P)-dependent dehydrogenase (short-subunit alcohol dehydrogenase family)
MWQGERSGAAMVIAMPSAVEALALELAPVHVNAVTPGLIDTPLLHDAYGLDIMTSDAIPAHARDYWRDGVASLTSAGHQGTPMAGQRSSRADDPAPGCRRRTAGDVRCCRPLPDPRRRPPSRSVPAGE